MSTWNLLDTRFFTTFSTVIFILQLKEITLLNFYDNSIFPYAIWYFFLKIYK